MRAQGERELVVVQRAFQGSRYLWSPHEPSPGRRIFVGRNGSITPEQCSRAGHYLMLSGTGLASAQVACRGADVDKVILHLSDS